MDIRMPGTDGVSATAAIMAANTPAAAPPRVVALTTFDADELVRRAITAGAVGYLVKDTPPGEIISAVRAVAAGHGVLSPAVTRPLLDLVQDASAGGQAQAGPRGAHRAGTLGGPGPVADGATNAEIGRQLYVSVATVKATVSRILTKLELDNRVQIAVVVRGSRRP